MLDIKRGIFMMMGPTDLSNNHWIKAIENELVKKRIEYIKTIDGQEILNENRNATKDTITVRSKTYFCY